MQTRAKKYKDSYKKYRDENKEKIKELKKSWYQKNKEKIKEEQTQWRDSFRFGSNREKVLERDNWQCVECEMTQEQHMALFGRSLTIDHIDGQGRNSKNPNNELENLQTLCLRCHSSKDHYWTKLLKRGDLK